VGRIVFVGAGTPTIFTFLAKNKIFVGYSPKLKIDFSERAAIYTHSYK